MTVFIRAYIYLHNFIHLHFRYKSKHVQNINKFTNINTHIYKLCILLALTSSFSWQITSLPHIGLWGIKQKISPYSSRMKFQLAKRYAKRYTFFLANKLRRITSLRNVNRKKQSSSRKTIRKQNSFVTLTEFISR